MLARMRRKKRIKKRRFVIKKLSLQNYEIDIAGNIIVVSIHLLSCSLSPCVHLLSLLSSPVHPFPARPPRPLS